MEIDITDLRSQQRYKSRHSLLISYCSPEDNNKLVKHRCYSEDVSGNGIKILTRRPLPLGMEFPIEVDISTAKQKFIFIGEVKWCLEIDDAPSYFTGIKIIKIIENSRENWLMCISRD